jgi:nucleotidyltransferase/DNA polymerase involved in DNA repair
MSGFHGEAMATLKGTIPGVIELICANADGVARGKLTRMRRRGEDLHWASLNAALTRGGMWQRQEIDYPSGLTRALVDSIATDWEPRIVEVIRGTVKELADRDVKLVEQLCEAARSHDDRIVVDAQIETQQEILKQHARTCISWTKEKLEELRSHVYEALVKAVSELMDGACKKAERAGRNRGAGAKKRILEVFEEAGTEAIQEAAKQSARILRDQYKKLLRELEEGFLKQHHDPLKSAFESLTKQELSRAKRSDGQRTKRILEKVDGFLAAVKRPAA